MSTGPIQSQVAEWNAFAKARRPKAAEPSASVTKRTKRLTGSDVSISSGASRLRQVGAQGRRRGRSSNVAAARHKARLPFVGRAAESPTKRDVAERPGAPQGETFKMEREM